MECDGIDFNPLFMKTSGRSGYLTKALQLDNLFPEHYALITSVNDIIGVDINANVVWRTCTE